MPGAQSSVLSSNTKDHSFNISMLIGLLIITITVLIIMSIIMKVWMKNRRKSKVVSPIDGKRSSAVPSKFSKLMSLQLLTPPTRPKLVFKKDQTLPVYRKSDTWDEYVKMIQSPGRLNDVVRTMKLNNNSSINISYNFQENANTSTSDNGKISYDNSNNSCNHTLQRESLHLQQKMYDQFS